MKTKRIPFMLVFPLLIPLLSLIGPTAEPAGQAPASAGEMESPACTIHNRTFQPGEEITYVLYYNWNMVWLSAGEVTFRVEEAGGQYHLSAYGATYPSYNWFFKVEDRYEAFVDTTSLLPSLSIRDVQEGKYTLYDRVEFDQINQKALSIRGKSKDSAQPSEYEFESCMHDILSIVYYVRNIQVNDMKEGESIPIRIFMDKEVWPLKVSFEGRDRKKRIRGKGKWKTVCFSPDLIEGEYFKDGDRMNIWVSDDRNRLPLLIESPVSVGSVKAVLKKYKGLRYPTDARL